MFRDQEVEVLLVAGDIFETTRPSAEALDLYNGFQAQVRDAPTLKRVVFVGRNHDSPSQLEASESVLGALGIHVVGCWSKPAFCRSVCRIIGESGDVELVVGAAPVIHEYRHGVDGLPPPWRHRARPSVRTRRALSEGRDRMQTRRRWRYIDRHRAPHMQRFQSRRLPVDDSPSEPRRRIIGEDLRPPLLRRGAGAQSPNDGCFAYRQW